MSFARGVVVGCLATAGLVTLPRVLEGYGISPLPSAASPPPPPEEVKAAGVVLVLDVYCMSIVSTVVHENVSNIIYILDIVPGVFVELNIC